MQELSIIEHTLKNGLKVYYCYTPHLVSFELSIHINTGSRDENKKNNGVSHFLEHMMFRGSRNYKNSKALARALESLGGESNAMTGIENTSYWLKGDAEKTLDAIEKFADFFLYPNYADLEIERNVILQEMASDFNEEGLSIDTESLAMQTLFADHSLGNPIIGNENSVRNMSIEDLEEKRKNFYIPSNCVLTIHTSTPWELVLKSIDIYFSTSWDHVLKNAPERLNANFNIPQKNNFKKPQNALCLQNNHDNQFALKLIFPTVGNLYKDVVAVTFFQRILDDGICTRLPANIREKYGLVYDISCDSQFFQEIGTFSVDATVSEECLQELLDKLGKELKNALIDKPSQEEIDHIKYRYIFDLKQIKETPSRLLNRKVTEHFMNSSFSIDDEIDSVKNMTLEVLYETVQMIFNSGRRAFVLVGPKARKRRDLVEKFMSNFD